MTNQSKSVFLQEILLENYPPFKNKEIKLTGEEQIQSLIKFYLENKKIVDSEGKVVNPKENARRFKINCIVGQNGVGKSRLFSKLIKIKTGKKVLLDDFFILEEGLHTLSQNIHKRVFSHFKKLSKEGLGFNSLMNSIIFFNLRFNNIVIKCFAGRKIEINNIEFAKTEKPWVLPYNTSQLPKKEENLKEAWEQEKWEKDKNDYKVLLHALLEEDGDIENKISTSKIQENAKSLFINLYQKYKNLERRSDIEKIIFIQKFFVETLYACNVVFDDGATLSSLSAGEKVILLRFTNIYMNILKQYNKWKKDFLILIDEPDLHLHLDWQRQYIQKLIDVFSTLNASINLHFIIATHSPFLISDLPTECIVALKKNSEWKTEVLQLKKNSTFWANFVDLIRNWFFFKEQMLMWSFAETIIKDIAEEERIGILMDNTHESSIKKKRNVKEREMIKKFIGDDFLKDNLLYFKP